MNKSDIACVSTCSDWSLRIIQFKILTRNWKYLFPHVQLDNYKSISLPLQTPCRAAAATFLQNNIKGMWDSYEKQKRL